MVPSIKLNNGKLIPSVGLGVYLTPANVAGTIVYDALDVGYRHVDSAAIYKNEKEVCDLIAKWLADNDAKREDVWYTTKIWNEDHGYEACKKAIDVCLEKAKAIGYIDLVLVHSPLSNTEKRHGTWLALQEAVDSGKIKTIGVSNYGVAHLKELLEFPDLKYKPAINQIELHPWLCRPELVKFCKDNEIAVEAYSPFARGKKFGDEYVIELSKKYGVSEAQVLVKWSLNKGFIPLPKTTSKERAASNKDVFSFDLTKEEMAKLDAKDAYWVSGWDPTTHPVDEDASA